MYIHTHTHTHTHTQNSTKLSLETTEATLIPCNDSRAQQEEERLWQGLNQGKAMDSVYYNPPSFSLSVTMFCFPCYMGTLLGLPQLQYL